MDNTSAGEIRLNNQQNIENVKQFLDNNDIEGAKEFLNNFLALNPDHGQALFIMAQLLEAEGNYKESAEIYEKIFPETIPDEFYERVLIVYENADKYDKLYEIFKAKYDATPDDMDICDRFANVCIILNKYDEAAELYNKILAKQPENFVALRQLADIYEHSNQMMFRLLTAKIAQHEENFEKAEKEYKKAFALVEKDDDIMQIRYQLAKLYKLMGKKEQAVDEYIFISSANENNFTVFLELAELYIELDNISSAINVLKRAIHIYPDNMDAVQMLADTYLDNGDLDKAEEHFEKLLDNGRDTVENKVNLAKVYLNLDKTDKTKKVLLSAEKQDPSSTEVLTAMAGYYTFVSDYEKAKGYCTRITQKYPKSPLGYKKFAQLYEAMGEQQLAHLNYGIYHELREENDDAINEYTNALQYKKDDIETIKRLAELHEKLNELEFAADYYHTLFELKIDLIETTKKIVHIYMQLKQFDMAQRYLDTAIKEDNNIEFYFFNAKCMYKMKDFDGALEALNYYKENTKSLENIKETEKLIEEIEQSKETSSNPLSWLFKFLDK